MTDSSERARARRIRLLMAVLLAAMALAGVWDLATDSARAFSGAHGVVELAFIAIAVLSSLVLGFGWQGAEQSLAEARVALESRRAERDAWQARAQAALRGLGEALDGQFEAWGLTPAEKETALLLLKGFSHKEVARLRGGSERTVRQHAVSVYRKSGLSGRAELAAFFFEDMLLPASERPETPGAGK